MQNNIVKLDISINKLYLLFTYINLIVLHGVLVNACFQSSFVFQRDMEEQITCYM